MWLKPHQWVAEPYFRTERKKVLDVVRKPTLSFMLFDQKYYNNDTRKFDSDKLKTLTSFSLGDIVDNNEYNIRNKSWWWDNEKEEIIFKDVDRIIKIPKFIPKDNDFDEQEKQEILDLERKQKEIQLRIKRQEEEIKLRKKNEEEKIITNDYHNLTLNQYKNAEILSLEEFNRNNYSHIKLKLNEEIIIINGHPVLDENGNIKIFER